MNETTPDVSSPVTVETDDGRIFSGVGVTPESLAETMEAREKPEPEKAETRASGDATAEPAPSDPDAGASLARNPDGTFKTSRGARRFAAMKADQLKIDEARQAAEQRAAELEKRLAALEQAKQPNGIGTTSPGLEPPKVDGFTEPEPTIEQFADQPDPYAAWNRALARWDRRKEAWEDAQKGADLDGKINQRLELEAARAQFVERINTVASEGAKAYRDWQATVTNPAVAEVIFPDRTYHAIVTAPNAAELVYTLAKDPALARKVAAEADPLRLGILLGSIRSSQAAVARPASTVPAVASSAPPPYQPVGSGSKTTSPSLAELADSGDDYDASGYRERRAAERKGYRR